RLFYLVFESHDGRALGAESEEKREPVSDIETAEVDSLKVLDPEWPIREADVHPRSCYVAFVPTTVIGLARSTTWLGWVPAISWNGEVSATP
ncbi:MAG: hypothetical protein ACM30D_16595, partial [Hyphomicrobiales bacterium]